MFMSIITLKSRITTIILPTYEKKSHLFKINKVNRFTRSTAGTGLNKKIHLNKFNKTLMQQKVFILNLLFY
jgi:hypothetical protein